jgi:hypothetical protein
LGGDEGLWEWGFYGFACRLENENRNNDMKMVGGAVLCFVPLYLSGHKVHVCGLFGYMYRQTKRANSHDTSPGKRKATGVD